MVVDVPFASGVRVDFDIELVDALAGDTYALEVWGADDSQVAQLRIEGTTLFAQICDATGCSYTSSGQNNLSVASFQHVGVELHWSDANPGIKVTVEGATVANGTMPARAPADKFHIVVGCRFPQNCADPRSFRIDNFVADQL
jgi:hypothetical protein